MRLRTQAPAQRNGPWAFHVPYVPVSSETFKLRCTADLGKLVAVEYSVLCSVCRLPDASWSTMAGLTSYPCIESAREATGWAQQRGLPSHGVESAQPRRG